MRWFRVNTVNDAGKPSSATVGKRLTEAYMLIVKGKRKPTDEEMKVELNRICKAEKIDGEPVNTTDKFTDFILSAIEQKIKKKK